MAKALRELPFARARNRRQAYVLLALGVLFLIAAIIVHLVLRISPFTDPLGIFLLGIGLLIAMLFNPRRLAVVTWMALFIGLEVFLLYKNIIPGRQTLPTFILAIGLALLGIALMGKRGYVRAGAISSAIMVLAVGVVEYFLFANELPSFVVSFLLSLWTPTAGLLLFGLYYLTTVGGK
ncbi:MAG TPA: hypothetical protein VKV40_15785 [Ktedonobacteraceae bacterium]|nr:hypothetical protein [Ktedonobacteraceae bacterium]